MNIKLDMNSNKSMPKKITVNVRVRDIKDNGKNIKNKSNLSQNTLDKENKLWEIKDNVLYQRINRTTQLSYSCYENVFAECKTIDLYNKCIREVIQDVHKGLNCTIFAYGQTGSGKTYTMLGCKSSPGVIKLCLEDILLKKNSSNQDMKVMISNVNNRLFNNNYLFEVSYLEIYNENVIDLIDLGKQIKIYSSGNTSMINNLTKVQIRTLDDAYKILDECEVKRKTGQTEYNERSSRSHTIFQIYITREGKTTTLSLIDLAGSERATGHTERRKEGSYINKSLLALGSVVNKLIKNEYVNYRDSKLTRILQQSLDGNSNVVSLCMISPNEDCVLESISTLKFAARLSKIELRERLERLVVKEDRETCQGCKCCKALGVETNPIPNNNQNTSNKLILEKNKSLEKMLKEKIDFNVMVQEEKIYSKDFKAIEFDNMCLKAENELYIERIKALEETISHLMTQNSSKRVNDLFVLERNMFNLQLEMIKRKKDDQL